MWRTGTGGQTCKCARGDRSLEEPDARGANGRAARPGADQPLRPDRCIVVDDTTKTLNDLIHLDYDAIQAYKQAIDACEIPEIRSQLTAFMGDHERHVSDLSVVVRSLGDEPAEGRDVKGFFIEGFTAIMSQGDRSALLAMRGNEELTTRRYDAARRADLPDDVRPLIERNYEDEARHLAWIREAIASRAWDTEKGADRAA